MLGDYMNKAKYIDLLFSDIKDEVEFDIDVLSLFKILKAMLQIDVSKSVEAWLYLVNKYNVLELKKDIDFEPLLNLYLVELLNYRTFLEVREVISMICVDNQQIIWQFFLNSFNENSGIYKYIDKLILNENYEEELKVIKDLVKRKDEFDKAIFDVLTFLKNIVFKHIQRGKTNINFLMQLANMAISRKDRAILKTLLIDYI